LRALLRPHLFPRIPVRFARWLAENRIPSAMMDVSDGLSADLARLCLASRCGARLWSDSLPLVRIPSRFAAPSLDPLRLALHGGDDYGLLFVVPRSRAPLLRRSPWPERVTNIGYLVKEPGVFLLAGDGRSSPLAPAGWDPFASASPRRNP
jgi:thiamine-monophosphate kinase